MYEEIKAAIERRMTDNLAAEEKAKIGHFGAAAKEDYEIIGIIESLSEEKPPKYDKEYLDEKIKRATKSWNGVDVDAFLAEIRGYEKPSRELENEAVSYCFDNGINISPRQATNFARHFAEWKKGQASEWHYPSRGEYPVVFGAYKSQNYPQIPCLVLFRGMFAVRFWNCQEECWDDEECDDYFCDKDGVEKWMYIDSINEKKEDEK